MKTILNQFHTYVSLWSLYWNKSPKNLELFSIFSYNKWVYRFCGQSSYTQETLYQQRSEYLLQQLTFNNVAQFGDLSISLSLWVQEAPLLLTTNVAQVFFVMSKVGKWDLFSKVIYSVHHLIIEDVSHVGSFSYKWELARRWVTVSATRANTGTYLCYMGTYLCSSARAFPYPASHIRNVQLTAWTLLNPTSVCLAPL